MAVNAGDKITASSFNALFTRLEAMRGEHLTASQNEGSSTTNITSAFATNIATTGNLAQANNAQTLVNDISYIENSGSFQTNKGSYTTGTATVPSVGSLLKATDFNGWDTLIGNMESVCANYGRYSGFYSGHYSGFYSGFYSGRYGGHYSGFYSGFYSGRYSGFYSSFYSGHYGSRYTLNYRFGGCFTGESLVNINNNNYKEIQNINLNDIVKSYDEKTKTFNEEKVINIQKHLYNDKIVTIVLDNNSIIKCTPSHVLLTKEGWKAVDPILGFKIHQVECSKLTDKDILIGIDREYNINKIELDKENYNNYVYNLSINNTHTYLINNIVAHNKYAILREKIKNKEKKE